MQPIIGQQHNNKPYAQEFFAQKMVDQHVVSFAMDEQLKHAKWHAREAQLSQKHEEILAKREMLLAANESLVGAHQQDLQVTLDGFQRTKTRNDQLIKELEALQSGMQKKALISSSDAEFIGMENSYWKMVEQEFPRWIARNEASRKEDYKNS